MKSLYEIDEIAWREKQIKMLESGKIDELDYDSLLKLLFEMTQSDKNSVLGLARIVVLHLLKLKYQPEKKTSSWFNSVAANRDTLLSLVSSKTLMNYFITSLPRVYSIAKRLASGETGLSIKTFPEEIPFSAEEILDENFFSGHEPPWSHV